MSSPPVPFPPVPGGLARSSILTRWIPWPWLDSVSLSFVTQVYLPLSRGWAAACGAGEDVERFRAEAGAALPTAVVAPALLQTAYLARRYKAATARWESAFFAADAPPEHRLAAFERARNRAATQFMLSRTTFSPWFRQFPPVRWQIAPPGAMEDRHGEYRGAPETAYRLNRQPRVVASHPYRRGRTRRYWLRYASPLLGDTVWARVVEPLDVADPPTLIFLHGIAMEQDLWPPTRNALGDLAKQGIRVVRPEGPWHGRRMLKGFYGGEPILARGPDGLLTFLRAWVAETAALIAWAREAGSPRVAIGGASLGALTSQLAATVSGSWSEDLRPDALLLIATTGRPMEIVTTGSLARGIGLPQILDEAGWTAPRLERWLGLFEPRMPPAVDPSRIVIVLGRADDLMPHEGGVDLALRWGVPADNVFVQPQGHFSVSLALLNDPAPMRRFSAILRGETTLPSPRRRRRLIHRL
jgi:pimeloyl-ACP methyl ester carboxylesterase